jgi:hypothetical protein
MHRLLTTFYWVELQLSAVQGFPLSGFTKLNCYHLVNITSMDHKSEYLLLFHGNNCYTNTPRYYVKRTLPVLSRLSLPKQNEQHTKCTKMHLHKALYSGSIRASSGRLPTIKSSSIPTLSNILFLNLGMCLFVSYEHYTNNEMIRLWYWHLAHSVLYAYFMYILLNATAYSLRYLSGPT